MQPWMQHLEVALKEAIETIPEGVHGKKNAGKEILDIVHGNFSKAMHERKMEYCINFQL